MYQVRHRTRGTYGSLYPDVSQEEQGYCKFETEEDAQAFINNLVTDGEAIERDLVIEPFDDEQNEKALKDAMIKAGYRKEICIQCHALGEWKPGFTVSICLSCLNQYKPNNPIYS